MSIDAQVVVGASAEQTDVAKFATINQTLTVIIGTGMICVATNNTWWCSVRVLTYIFYVCVEVAKKDQEYTWWQDVDKPI